MLTTSAELAQALLRRLQKYTEQNPQRDHALTRAGRVYFVVEYEPGSTCHSSYQSLRQLQAYAACAKASNNIPIVFLLHSQLGVTALYIFVSIIGYIWIPPQTRWYSPTAR